MLQAFIKFNKGLFKLPFYTILWVGLLVILNAVAPLFFIPRPEAIWTFLVFMINAGLMIAITHYTGFSRLLGLGHILWLPLVLYLAFGVEPLVAHPLHAQWLISIIAVNSISLVIDVADIVRYIAGDRSELVEGL